VWCDSPGVTLITADGTWCLFFDPQTKWQTYEWKSSSPSRSKKFIFDRDKRKGYTGSFFGGAAGALSLELALEIKL